ncbi:MAG: YARHG domain-containing protein [Putridiphycobacter sp.]
MKYFLSAFFLFTLVVGCQTDIKNRDTKIEVEKGTELVDETPEEIEKVDEPKEINKETEHLLGFWVGYFEEDDEKQGKNNMLYVDEAFVWTRENKINISIDEIIDTIVKGHSVVAGNDRPFEGTVKKDEEGAYHFEVAEPGDDKYDGEFKFTIQYDELIGKWTAYKNIDIKYRKYKLEKKEFKYDPDIMLASEKWYIDWENKIETSEEVDLGGNEVEEWISTEFATSTDMIYEINASNTVLKKEDVENLKKGDLKIIRNTIYARHGYSFKNRPMRVFFDAQKWYIPVHTDIKSDFTDIEKDNIQLLLKYEQNAEEYYDYFGRG